jgi:hypothetical protein
MVPAVNPRQASTEKGEDWALFVFLSLALIQMLCSEQAVSYLQITAQEVQV